MLHKFFHFHFQLAWWNSDTTNISQFQKFFVWRIRSSTDHRSFPAFKPCAVFFSWPCWNSFPEPWLCEGDFFGVSPGLPPETQNLRGWTCFSWREKRLDVAVFLLEGWWSTYCNKNCFDFGMFLFVIVVGILKGGLSEMRGTRIFPMAFHIRFPFKHPFAVTPFP